MTSVPGPENINLDPGGIATAVVVLGHGSRAPQAAPLLKWLAGKLEARVGLPVLAASLQFNDPGLDDCCRRLVTAGARRIIIAPYFLFEGNHMQRDIPGELDTLRAELPGIEFVLADPLGADERLVEVVASRITATGNGMLKAALDEEPGSGSGMAPDGQNVEHEKASATRAGSPAAESIEKQSFDIIDDLLGISGDEEPEYQVVRRVIHATGDPSLAGSLKFSAGAVTAAMASLSSNTTIICDVNMVAAGLGPTAVRLGHQVLCRVAAPEAAALARAEGITRSAAGIRLLAGTHGIDNSLVVIGNAPTALFEVLRQCVDGRARPALVVGAPVGFVGAAESKQALIDSGLNFIALPGNRGGSNIAVAIANALMKLDPGEQV